MTTTGTLKPGSMTANKNRCFSTFTTHWGEKGQLL